MSVTVDISGLREATEQWINLGAGQALDLLRQRTRDRAPYGASESGHDGPHLVDTEEARVTVEGEVWEGTLAYTADHASYLDEGTGPHEIHGDPLLAFRWGGQLVIVHSVQHPGSHLHVGWFSDVTTAQDWANAVREAFDALGSPV